MSLRILPFRKMTQMTSKKTDQQKPTAPEIKALVDEFNAVGIKHKHQEDAKEGVEFARDLCESVAIIVLAGPTGVGKTRMLVKLVEDQLSAGSERMQKDPLFIPVIATTAIAHGHRKFDFKRCYLDCLTALGDPFAGKRTRTKEEKDRARKDRFKSAGETISAALLRMDLELELERHGTVTWVLDEADHILTGGASGLPGDQFAALKSFAQITGVTLILSGTGKLPTYLAASGQLSRRTKVIVLSHYHWDNDVQVSQYASAFHSLMERLPIDGFPAVTTNVEEFFIGGVGCVGVAKDWIARSYAQMLTDQERILTLEHFRATRLSPVQLKTMALELDEAEQWVRSAKSDTELKVLLGVEKPADAAASAPPASAKTSKSGQQKSKPFTRNPVRDPVGVLRGVTREETV